MFVLMALAGWVFQRAFSSLQPTDLAGYSGQITVASSEMIFGRSSDGEVVSVVGVLKNESDVTWQKVVVEVRFLDPEGKLIDVGDNDKAVYYTSIIARGEAAFKVRSACDLPREKYADYRIRVRSARDARRFP